MAQFCFRCKTNPRAALLVLDTFWEAEEMKNHPDYERVNELGEVIVDESATAPNRIPIVVSGR